MKTRTALILSITHLFALAIGFAAGIYVLPILIAPPAPDLSTVEQAAENSRFAGEFSRDRRDSDALHWGEGRFSIGADAVSFVGKLSPGPDFRLYLSPEFVETEADFQRLKPAMLQVGDIKTFKNFIVPLREGVDPSKYNTAIVWCESFGEYITSGMYQAGSE